jgi:uncharacterized protein GlcG (DUF336 family)
MLLRKLVLGLSFALFAVVAAAQDRPPYGPEVTLEQAQKIAAGAVEESRKNGWRMAIAIVDNHGFLIYFERMADTQTASVQVALDKATAAAMYRRPTKAFQDGIAAGGVGLRLLTLRGAYAVEGGLPIMINGKVAGAIGVSGANADEDTKAAVAGLKSAGY